MGNLEKRLAALEEFKNPANTRSMTDTELAPLPAATLAAQPPDPWAAQSEQLRARAPGAQLRVLACRALGEGRICVRAPCERARPTQTIRHMLG